MRRRRAAAALSAGFFLLGLAGCSDTALTTEDTGEEQKTGPAIVRLVPSEPVFQVGETVVVQVLIQDGVNVGSTPFHLMYDPVVLRFLPPAVEGPFMSSDGASTVFLFADDEDRIVVGLSRLGAPQGMSGSGILAVFEFEAMAAGPCGFGFSGASVKDPQAQNLPAAFHVASSMVE